LRRRVGMSAAAVSGAAGVLLEVGAGGYGAFFLSAAAREGGGDGGARAFGSVSCPALALRIDLAWPQKL
jgi:hypothetical protein